MSEIHVDMSDVSEAMPTATPAPAAETTHSVGDLLFNDPPKQTSGDTPPTRDYSGLSDEDAALARNMSNEAFSKFVPVYRDFKGGKYLPVTDVKPVPLAFDVEDGYTLSTDYKQLSRAVTQAGQERQYYNELAKLPDGEEFQVFEGWNTDGTPKFGIGVTKMDPQLRARALALAMRIDGDLPTLQGKLKELQENHVKVNGELKTALDSEFKRVYGPFMQDARFAEGIKKSMAIFPAHVRDHPMVKHVAAAHLLIPLLFKRLQEAQGRGGQTRNTPAPRANEGQQKPVTDVDKSFHAILQAMTE